MPIGMTLSSEEHGPARLVEMALMAEDSGFDFVSISDHFHPWTTQQGHSPFVWSVLGAIARATDDIDLAVGVTCPTFRIHPAILAQAVATTALLADGRLTWGVGSGEALNEHIFGHRWPPAEVRIEMMEEAVLLIRRMWAEKSVTHHGKHFTVEDARIFDRPDTRPPIIVSAFGERAATVAAGVGDGLWTTGTGGQSIEVFKARGGSGPVYAQLTLCWGEDEEAAIDLAHRVWPNTGVPGQLPQDLRTIAHMEQAASLVTRSMIADSIPCGPDPEPVLDSVRSAVEGGIDHVYLHQIGPDQEGFLRFWETELRDPVRALLS